jgi:Signal transduction histidine kinase
MLVIQQLKNRYVVLVIALVITAIIGFADYVTGPELSFSFFYLIPISLLALYRGTKVSSVIICAVFSAVLWFYAEYNSRKYTMVFFPIWNGFVSLVMFLAIGVLIFYLKEKDKKLKMANDHLQALNEEKNKFIGIAAHDLRSSIGGIFSLSDFLIDEYKDNVHPKVWESLLLIKTLSKKMLNLLKNLLDVSKIESGKVELQRKEQDLIAFTRQQIVLSQVVAKHKNISIAFQPEMEQMMLAFDEHYMSEVVDNLLSNAIKYSYRNSEIILKISMFNKDTVLTEVFDFGKGIPKEEQEMLFSYFQTTTTTPTEGESSTGLGLAIAKRIVTLHGGEIGLTSELNHGSTFFFTLPI